MRQFFEILKRAVIALSLFALGCGGGAIGAQILFEGCAGTLGIPWWVGANGWFVNTIARPWIGVPLGLASSWGYCVYLSARDEEEELHLLALALVNNQQETNLPGTPLVSKLADSVQERVGSHRAGGGR